VAYASENQTATKQLTGNRPGKLCIHFFNRSKNEAGGAAGDG
jgi:hypothetical protein